jgi:hypothetical protein
MPLKQRGFFMSIKTEIKVLLAKSELSMRKLIELMNDKYNRKDTVQNLSNKLNRDTIKYRDVEEIAETLGYKIEFNPKK